MNVKLAKGLILILVSVFVFSATVACGGSKGAQTSQEGRIAAANGVSLAVRKDGTVAAYGTDTDMIEAVSAWRDISDVGQFQNLKELDLGDKCSGTWSRSMQRSRRDARSAMSTANTRQIIRCIPYSAEALAPAC